MKLTPDQKRRIVERFVAGEKISWLVAELWVPERTTFGYADAAVNDAIRQHIRAGRKRAGRRK